MPAEPSLHRDDFHARSLLHSATAVSLGYDILKRAHMKRRLLLESRTQTYIEVGMIIVVALRGFNYGI